VVEVGLVVGQGLFESARSAHRCREASSTEILAALMGHFKVFTAAHEWISLVLLGKLVLLRSIWFVHIKVLGNSILEWTLLDLIEQATLNSVAEDPISFSWIVNIGECCPLLLFLPAITFTAHESLFMLFLL